MCCYYRRLWNIKGLVLQLKKNDEIVEPADRIVVVSLHDIYDPRNSEILVYSGDMITEDMAVAISDAPIETVEIRSALTCEAKRGLCAKCYGRTFLWKHDRSRRCCRSRAAQSIGEPGTQLTLRTFHFGVLHLK